MAEYIEKQALLKKMHSSHSTPLIMGHTTDEDVMFKTMVSLVEEHPTADVVEVKQGKWEKKTFIIFDSEKVGYKCSECNTTWDTSTNYCPNCGAKMDAERKCDK